MLDILITGLAIVNTITPIIVGYRVNSIHLSPRTSNHRFTTVEIFGSEREYIGIVLTEIFEVTRHVVHAQKEVGRMDIPKVPWLTSWPNLPSQLIQQILVGDHSLVRTFGCSRTKGFRYRIRCFRTSRRLWNQRC